jgi:hypothetical protein
MRNIFFLFSVLVLAACNNLYKDVHNLQSQNDQQQAQIDNLKQNVDLNIAVLVGLAETNHVNFAALEIIVNQQVVQLATLSGYLHITALLDPCSDYAGYDEVLMRLSTGQVIAYFESGGKRHLTVLLPNTTYQTTDAQNCVFSLDNNGNLN